MKVYLLQQLWDSSAWVTIEVYKNKIEAEKRFKRLANKKVYSYKLEVMELR